MEYPLELPEAKHIQIFCSICREYLQQHHLKLSLIPVYSNRFQFNNTYIIRQAISNKPIVTLAITGSSR